MRGTLAQRPLDAFQIRIRQPGPDPSPPLLANATVPPRSQAACQRLALCLDTAKIRATCTGRTPRASNSAACKRRASKPARSAAAQARAAGALARRIKVGTHRSFQRPSPATKPKIITPRRPKPVRSAGLPGPPRTGPANRRLGQHLRLRGCSTGPRRRGGPVRHPPAVLYPEVVRSLGCGRRRGRRG
jgi:hypothetical protein